MLAHRLLQFGTNDAMFRIDSWPDSCVETLDCPFALDLGVLISLAQRRSHQVLLAVPSPVMLDENGYGINASVVNQILPVIIPRIAIAHDLPPPVNVLGALRGNELLAQRESITHGGFSPQLCKLPAAELVAFCADFCDRQSCDTGEHLLDLRVNPRAAVVVPCPGPRPPTLCLTPRSPACRVCSPP